MFSAMTFFAVIISIAIGLLFCFVNFYCMFLSFLIVYGLYLM
jgi:hypothetical protein